MGGAAASAPPRGGTGPARATRRERARHRHRARPSGPAGARPAPPPGPPERPGGSAPCPGTARAARRERALHRHRDRPSGPAGARPAPAPGPPERSGGSAPGTGPARADAAPQGEGGDAPSGHRGLQRVQGGAVGTLRVWSSLRAPPGVRRVPVSPVPSRREQRAQRLGRAAAAPPRDEQRSELSQRLRHTRLVALLPPPGSSPCPKLLLWPHQNGCAAAALACRSLSILAGNLRTLQTKTFSRVNNTQGMAMDL
ncbi:basic proline-rich protein-like [Poecile atricapillus]|uniref:basic proline-rich protein-like n=1 Tax=Poecile atricapillus TaxID=48891 RepID=UPI00273A0A46|nr:basic proline-rich protein-like [Poecile atricapillus]